MVVCRLVVVGRRPREPSLRGHAWGCREPNCSDGGVTNRLHVGQRPSERLGQVRLVKQHEGVRPKQSCVDGFHAVRNAVASKQQPRPDLIYGRTQNDRLGRRPRPVVLQRCPSTESLGRKRRLAVSG